ncbi:type II and III secretion system protein family protein, partial [Dickeya dadantii]|nr:type II and III secretion system protein family protein [Dickeya dadantii]
PSIPSGVIVRGSVDTPQDAKRVIDSIQTYIKSSVGGGQGGGGGGGEKLPGSSESSGKVINQLKIKTPSQINIQVRVVEVSRKLTSELGFNWAASLSTGSGNMSAGSGSRLNLFNATTGRFANPTDSGFLNFGRSRLSGLLTAMNQQGMATVLAEPNLTAMSGETAAFAAGGVVSIVLTTTESVTLAFKASGV